MAGNEKLETASMHEAHPADKAAAADLEKRLDFTPEEVERYNSPYEVVRVTVSTKDDPTLPTLTFRFWVLGIFFNCVLAFVNQFFWYRATPLTVTGLVAQLLSYPLGSAMARILPDKRVNLGLFSFSLDPGRDCQNQSDWQPCCVVQSSTVARWC